MNKAGIDESLKNDDNFSAMTAFSADMTARLYESKQNVMISPLSVYLALAMTANAAKGETLSGMATALNLPKDELNSFCGYLYAYFMENDVMKNSVKIANSIWCNEGAGASPKQSFLQTNAAYYGADVYKTPFTDDTVSQINKWVSVRTEGMIDKLLQSIPAEAVAYLINTVFLESKWAGNEYNDFNGEFTDANGNKSTKKFLKAANYTYSYSENALAVSRHLENNLKFVGILPNGDLDDYMAALDGAEMKNILTNWDNSKDVIGKFPEFSFDYSASLKNPLAASGMGLAFDQEKADFSEGFDFDSSRNVYISNVLHKTKIEVTKYGVKAAAATAVEMGCTSADPGAPRQKIVINLDRPFMFALVDTVYNIPIFIGTYNG